MPDTAQTSTTSEGLVRAIGRWSLVALTVNSILGSGIFGLPSQLADKLGRLSPWAVLLAGAAMAVIIACYGEVSSQFSGTGGTYIYCRAAFGQLTGLQVGWMMMLSRLTACAANANLLVIYLATFWPQTTRPLARFAIVSILLGFLLIVNYVGVRGGTLGQQHLRSGQIGAAGHCVPGGSLLFIDAPSRPLACCPGGRCELA